MAHFGIQIGSSNTLTDEEIIENTEPSIFKQILNKATTSISTILDTLDVPGSLTRGVLSGRGLKRTSGKEFLEEFGLLPEEGFKRSLASFLAEGIDPLLFTGSIIGLTKVGKIASRVEKLHKESVKLKSALKTAGRKTKRDKEAVNRIVDQLKQNNNVVKQLTGKHINEVGPAEFLRPSRLEQAKAGQRGATFGVPFGRELGKIPFPNKTIARLGDAIAATSIVPKPAVEKFRKLFSTKSDSPVQDFLKVQSERETAEASIRGEKLFADFSDELNVIGKKMVKDSKIGTGPILTLKQAENIVKAQITEVTESLVSPEVHRSFQEGLEAAKQNKIISVANKINRETRDLIKKKPSNLNQLILSQERKFNSGIKQVTKRYDEEIFNAEKKRVRLQTTLETIGSDGSFPRRVAESFLEAGEDLLKYQQDSGIAITSLDDFLAYFPHVFSANGKRLFQNNEKFRKSFGKDIIGSIPSHSKRRKFRHDAVQELNKLVEKKFGVKNVYVTDPFVIFKQREIATQLAVNKARSVQIATSLYSRSKTTVEEVMKKGKNRKTAKLIAKEENEGLINLSEVMSANGMNSIAVNGKRISVDVNAFHNQRAKILDETFQKQLGSIPTLPESVARDLLNVHKLIDTNVNLPLAIFDTINETFRKYVTSFIPAHIGTNTIGNTLMNLISIGPVATIKNTARAAIILGQRKEAKLKTFFQKLPEADEAGRKFAEEFYRAGGGGSRFDQLIAEQSAKIRSGKSRVDAGIDLFLNNKIVDTGFAVNTYSEEVAKLTHFISQREAGKTVNEAIFSTKKYLFDYGDLTDFEKKTMRRLVLFYTFSRKNLPLMITETIANRKAYVLGKTSTATLATEKFVPNYVKETGSITIGNDEFIDIRNPVFEPNKFSSQEGSVSRALERVGGQLVPGLKLPLELFSGREFFRGKPLGQLNRVPKTLFGIEAKALPFTKTFIDKSGVEQTVADPALLQLIRNLPTARVQQTIDDVFNPEISSASIFGPRARFLDEELRTNKFLQERIINTLESDPTVASFRRFFPLSENPTDRTKDILSTLNEKNKQFKELIGN